MVSGGGPRRELPEPGARNFACGKLLPSARHERRVGAFLVRAAWERRPEGPAYLLSTVKLLYLAGKCLPLRAAKQQAGASPVTAVIGSGSAALDL